MENSIQLATMLKTLGHPCRIQIVRMLNKSKELSVGEICDATQLEQSLISHHLKNMRLNGILIHRRAGKKVFYSLTKGDFFPVIQSILKFK